MKRHPFREMLPGIIAFIVLLIASPLQKTSAGDKPEIDVPEVVISASAPLLMSGVKDPIPALEISAAGSPVPVADSVIRTPLGFPEILELSAKPQLREKSPCLIPWLGGAFASVRGVKGHMYKASKAWSKGDWQTVVDELKPVIREKPPVPECPRALYFTARSLENLGNTPGAMEFFDRLRREYPDSSFAEHACYALGWLYLKYHNLPHAKEIIDEYLHRYPAGVLAPYVRYLKAAVHHQAGEYPEAIRALEGIVAGYPLFPHKAQVQFWLAENQFFSGQTSRAEANYTLYIENYPNGEHIPDAFYGRAFCRLETDDTDGAMADFKHVVTSFPSYPHRIRAAFQAGKIAASRGDKQNALTFFRIAAQSSDPSSTDALEARAWLRFESDAYGEAAKLFRKTAETAGRPHRRAEARFMEALAYYKNGRYQRSADLFIALAKSSSGRTARTAWANAGIARMKTGDYNVALSLLKKSLETPGISENQAVYKLYLAEALYRTKRYAESLETYRSMENAPPALEAERLSGIAWNLYAMHRWNEAAEAFHRLAEAFPDSSYHPEALLREAECHFNADDFARAATQFQTLIDAYPLHPESLEARIMLAKIQWVQGDMEKAQALLEDALTFAGKPRDRQRVHMIMGDMAQDRNRFEEAATYFERAYFDAPDSGEAPEALLKMANNLYNRKRFEEAEEAYRRIIREFPDSETAVAAQYAVGLTYLQRRRLNDYLDECRKIVSMHPGSRQSALALLGAAEILSEQDRQGEAVVKYRTLLTDYRRHINVELVMFKLAQALEASGRNEEAGEVFSSLLETYPHGLFAADAARALARLAMRSGDTEAALTYDTLVVEKFPEHPMYPEALLEAAGILLDAGRLDEAETFLKRLFNCEPPPDSGYLFEGNLLMGTLEYKRNRCDEAEVYVSKAERSADRRCASKAKMIRCRCLEAAGKSEDAVSCYLRIGYLFPEQNAVVFKALTAAGKLLADLGRRAEARSVLKRALKAAADAGERAEAAGILRTLGLEHEKDTGGDK